VQTPPQITFKNIAKSEALETLIQSRIEKLGKVHPNIIGCRVVVETPHRSANSGKVPLGIAVEVVVPGRPTIVAKESEERRDAKDDHTSAVHHAFEAVERQLRTINDMQQQPTKVHEAEGETGVVLRLFPDQGYGFVEVRGSPDLYFTRNAVQSDQFDALTPGMMVHITRATLEGPMGPQASSVRLLGGQKSPG
jgi:cold shock CspA family protein/ribosome-associated translation inhibitor RaiA